MKIISISDLPTPSKSLLGFPWTEGSTNFPPQYFEIDLPKISLVTPSFNQGQFIEETIRSVILQNYPNLEYIIIDGGSTDTTVSIIKKYDKWINCWVSEPDKGQSDAINKGLERVTGDIFNWINSDDLLAPNALWEIAEYFLKNKNIDVLMGRLQNIELNILSKVSYRMKYFDNVESTMNFGYMSQPSLFFRLKKIKLLNGIDIRFNYCMDLDLWYRYLSVYGLSAVTSTEQTLAYYRVHKATKSANIQQANAERLVLILTLLSALGISKERLYELKPPTPNIEIYHKSWDLNAPFINKNRLFAYLIEHILEMPYFDYPLWVSFKFWFISFYYQCHSRRQYFFTLPLRFIYRKIKKYKKGHK